jgi:hypothetical protein
MANFKLQIKKGTTSLGQTTLDLAELGLLYTTNTAGSVVTGGQLYVGLGATNATGYAAISMVGHTHGLADIVSGVGVGALVYGSSSGSFINLPIGNANDILKVVGTAPV